MHLDWVKGVLFVESFDFNYWSSFCNFLIEPQTFKLTSCNKAEQSSSYSPLHRMCSGSLSKVSHTYSVNCCSRFLQWSCRSKWELQNRINTNSLTHTHTHTVCQAIRQTCFYHSCFDLCCTSNINFLTSILSVLAIAVQETVSGTVIVRAFQQFCSRVLLQQSVHQATTFLCVPSRAKQLSFHAVIVLCDLFRWGCR